MERARNAAARHVCIDQLLAYWNNGRLIVEYEQNGRDRAEYGDKTLVRLSKRLTERLGRGFSRSNLQYMRLLYLKHPICQTLSGKLSPPRAYSARTWFLSVQSMMPMGGLSYSSLTSAA